MQEKEQGSFSLAKFYERRARRILPALFFVMLCCLPFAWFWMFPAQLKDFAHSLIAVPLCFQYLILERKWIFCASCGRKAVVTYLELAVEKQYYLFFPLLILTFWRFRYQYLTYIIVIIAIASLALSEYQSRLYPSANFYLAPTRSWELLSGVLGAFYLLRGKQSHNNALSISGFALIIYSIFAFTEATPFPSLYALVPVAGTSLADFDQD